MINIVLAIVLVDRYGVLGLGLAFGLAYLVSAVWALQVLALQGARVPGCATIADEPLADVAGGGR